MPKLNDTHMPERLRKRISELEAVGIKNRYAIANYGVKVMHITGDRCERKQYYFDDMELKISYT